MERAGRAEQWQRRNYLLETFSIHVEHVAGDAIKAELAIPRRVLVDPQPSQDLAKPFFLTVRPGSSIEECQ